MFHDWPVAVVSDVCEMFFESNDELKIPQHQYLRVLTEIFCLWRVTYSDKSAQAILYHFPGPEASLHPPPILLIEVKF